MDEDHFDQLSSNFQSQLETLKKFPVLNIFENVKQKWEFLKKCIQHYKFLQMACPSKYEPPSLIVILQTLCQEIDSKLLSSLEFVTISKLVNELHASYCLFLPLKSSVEEKSLYFFTDIVERMNENNLTPCLRKKKFLLLAKIIQVTPHPSSVEDLSCFLFLSDGSSKIHCQIKASLCDEILLLLNKWILISDANIIFSSQLPGILEICSKPIPVGDPCPFPRNPISGMNIKSASIFLHKREKFEPEEICVTGRVSAISEVFKIKQNYIFLIELSHNEEEGHFFHILFKDQFLHWQPLLNPGSCYIFSALRASTLVKGCGPCHVKVFVPCLTCKVWPQKYCELQEQELKDLLLEGIQVKELNQLPIDKKVFNFTSYQGCITDTNQANNGIYILNHQVRLHLFYVPLIHHFGHLRVGTIIEVHNVHLKEYSEVPKIQLFCCMKSCIKVLKFSPLNTLSVPVDVNWVQEMLFSHSTTINWILDVKNWLISNSSLLGFKQQKHIESIWNSFLQSTVNKKTEIAVTSRRNLLQEFFSSDHQCPITIERNDAHVEQCFPSPVCPSNLLEDFSNLILELKQQSMSANIGENIWEPLVNMIQDTKMLIGYVGVSSVTGRLCLVDRLNSINIICQPWQINPTSGSLPHICTASCLLQQRGTKLVFPCPFAHSWCLGRLIIINKYQMVLEKFNSGSNMENLIKYVQFSLEDIVVLNDSVLPSFYPQLGLVYTCKESIDDGNTCTCQMFMFSHKESLMGHNLSTENPALRFTASGYFLGNAFQLPAKDVFRYVTKFPKSEDLQNATLEKNCEKENYTLDSEPYKRVVLLFENTLTQWYDLLQNVGSCYMLVVMENNLEAFKSFHSASLVKALQNSNSKYPVQMPQNAIVQELSDWHLITIYKTKYISLLNLKKLVSTKMSCHKSPAYSVSDILSPSVSENIVSLLPTKILSRTHPENMYATNGSSDFPINRYDTELELSTLGGNSIKLVLQDIKSHKELTLFMNLENTSYPLGLLDGAVVEFHLLQRMISRKNKIYCKFIAISSVRILAASHTGDAESRFHSNFPDKDIEPKQMPRTNDKEEWGTLSLMLSDFYSDRSQLWTQAFVAQVKTLTVKTICTMCHCLSSFNRCSNKTCNNTQFHMSVYVCLLLDDGTSTVCACIWQEDLLLQILGLSMTQWKDLVALIHSKRGEICLESEGKQIFPDITNVETSIHHFLTLLCDNPLVKRKWWMKLKRKTPFAVSTYEKRFPCREIGFLAGKIKTRCLPFLQAEILSIQEDPPFDILSI